MGKNDPTIAVGACVYGSGFEPLIVTFLESWRKQVSSIILICGNMRQSTYEELQCAYPDVSFVKIDRAIHQKSDIRISQKVFYWNAIANNPLASQADYLILADIDTMATSSVNGMCKADIVVTVREPTSTFFLNSGVVALSKSAVKSGFVEKWSESTSTVLNSPDLLAISTSSSHRFGGGDQYGLMSLICEDDGLGRLRSNFGSLSVSSVDCATFNACENKIDQDLVRVLHLKASLQNFLLRRRPLVGGRRLEDSMFQLKAAFDANSRGIQRLANSFSATPEKRLRKYRLRTPPFMRRDMSVPVAVAFAYRALTQGRIRLGQIRNALHGWRKSS
ncbi:hypothetical protein MCEMIH16_01638 [Caulobacteraceae bacterium]